jgi:hypothetical protein
MPCSLKPTAPIARVAAILPLRQSFRNENSAGCRVAHGYNGERAAIAAFDPQVANMGICATEKSAQIKPCIDPTLLIALDGTDAGADMRIVTRAPPSPP